MANRKHKTYRLLSANISNFQFLQQKEKKSKFGRFWSMVYVETMKPHRQNILEKEKESFSSFSTVLWDNSEVYSVED